MDVVASSVRVMRRHWIRERQAFAAKVFITILCIGVYTCLRHSAQFALFSANLHAGVRSLPHSTLVDLMGTFLGRLRDLFMVVLKMPFRFLLEFHPLSLQKWFLA